MSTPLPVPEKNWPNEGSPEIQDFTSEPGEVLQEQEYDVAKVPPIPTIVCEPVRSLALPSKKATYYTVSGVGTTVGVQLVGRDPRRKSITIIGLDQDVNIGSTQAEAVIGARIPAVVPFVLTTMDEIWATSVSSTTDISVICEFWAD